MKSISTHILDTALGRPAEGVATSLEFFAANQWVLLGQGSTDADGRLRTLVPEGHPLQPGYYRITFAVGAYHERIGQQGFYPEISIQFEVRDTSQHYHVPLLLNPYGFSTYRGS